MLAQPGLHDASMLSVLAKLQRELIVANTRDALAAGRARGSKGGVAPSSTPTKPYWPDSSMTAATAPCSRSPTSSASPRLNDPWPP